MSAPRAVITEELHVPFGSAVFESLKYPHSIWRVNRITVSRDGFSYEVYGSFQLKHAGTMAWRLPPACEALDGLKATAGMYEFRSARRYHLDAGTAPAHLWHLRIDAPGRSGLATGDRYSLEKLGAGDPLEGPEIDAVEYPVHAALSGETNAGRPSFG